MEQICEGDLLHGYSIRSTALLVFRTKRTHVASKVFLLAQYGLVSIELTFELRDEFLDALLVHRLTTARLDHLFPENDARNRIELRILDACCLLELCVCLGLCRDQLWARPERRNVAADSARLEQLETVVLLLDG